MQSYCEGADNGVCKVSMQWTWIIWWMRSKLNVEYYNALLLLMDVTSPFVLQVNNTLTTTTGKGGI